MTTITAFGTVLVCGWLAIILIMSLTEDIKRRYSVPSDALERYVAKLCRLHVLRTEEKTEIAKEDEILNEMDGLWQKLSVDERRFIRSVSKALNGQE